MKRPTLIFASLCVAAYGAQIVDCVALNRIGDAGIIVMLDVVWFVLLLALAVWSLTTFWRHWIRAAVGVLVCALCYYQHIQNTKIVW
jgi:hypothetical protein